MTEERTRRIQERAHSLWEKEGHPPGRDAQHWFQAEREIDAEDAARASAPGVTAAARRQPKLRPVRKAGADTSGANQGEATSAAAEVSAEKPVKTRGHKTKAMNEEGSEAPRTRRGRSSRAAAEVSVDASAKTGGRKPKAVKEDGAEALKAAQRR